VAGSEDRLEIRALTEIEEFREAVKLQKTIWGFEDIDLLPPRLFVVSTKIGGQVFGAFDRNKMVAFLLAIPGVKPGGKGYIHSHMLGVLKDYRNHGLGRKLKLIQREDALARGFDLIEWTFDPLELKNAFFNIERLGAVVRRFVYNQYGTTSSALHGGLPTDRCIAEWHIDTARARTLADNGTIDRGPIAARISIPADIAEIKARDPEKARAIQASAGADFSRYFREGLAVVGIETTPETGTYLLGPWESN
jgi:predicted GNAT superfamily acetyltransferase